MRHQKYVLAATLGSLLLLGHTPGVKGTEAPEKSSTAEMSSVSPLSGEWTFFLCPLTGSEESLGTKTLQFNGNDFRGGKGFTGTVQGPNVRFHMEDAPGDFGEFQGTTVPGLMVGTYVWYLGEKEVQYGEFRLVKQGPAMAAK